MMECLYGLYLISCLVVTILLIPTGLDIGFKIGEWFDERRDR